MALKYVIFTFSGEGAGLAYRLKQEGNEVLLAVLKEEKDIKTRVEKPGKPEDPEDKKRRLSIMDGLLQKMDAWEAVKELKKIPPQKRSRYFLFFDMNHCWRLSEALEGMGFNGNFPTEEDRLLEVDRDETKKFVEKEYPDLEVTKVFKFDKIVEAIKFLNG
jgi:hypothetical protein